MRKVVWLVVGGLMALSLVLAACAPAAVQEEEKKITVTEKEEAAKKEVVEKGAEKKIEVATDMPKYGGRLNVSTTGSPSPRGMYGGFEQFMGGDWVRARTGLLDPLYGSTTLEDSMMPLLMESWEMPQQGVWILNLRRGIHWQKTPFPASAVTNGRELTIDDVIDSLNWQINEQKRSWIWVSQPAIARATTWEKTGPWQVTMKTPIDYLTSFVWIIQGAGYHRVFNVPVARQYKHEWIYQGEGWPYQEGVSTGPWIMAEIVAGSYTKQIRNRDYWGTDPIGPGKGNQVPYIDEIVTLSLPDRSTQLAALRTGKIDYLGGFTYEEWQRETKLTPRYMWARGFSQTSGNRVIYMRTDKKDLPYSKLKVRQALMMATDFEKIKNDYYNGEAEIDIWPLPPVFKTAGSYAPLSEMPESVQQLYRYNPEKAKQLLKEAGYPNGFKASIVVTSAGSDVDDISIFKDMWAKVGVELVLDIKEASVFSQVQARRDYPEMLYRFCYCNWSQMFYWSPIRAVSSNNLSFINDETVGTFDPVIEEAFFKAEKAMMVNMPEVHRVVRELRPYLMEQAHVIPRPTPYTYSIWQPWLKNYYGSSSDKYHWIDQDLKKKLGF